MLDPTPQRLIDLPTHENTSIEQIPILTYELGDLSKNLTYVQRYSWTGKDTTGYKIEAKIAMSDLLAQLMLMCEREGWNFWELVKLGKERFTEKVERHRRYKE